MSAPGRLLAGCLALLAACGPSERPGTPPKHVMLFTVDTLRADHLSFAGYERTTGWIDFSPEERLAGRNLALDDLAEDGVRFANAFAPRGQTLPSLATLMTGRTPLETGVIRNQETLPTEATTLAELFAAAGFRTAGFTANQVLMPASGIAQGFETYENLRDEEGDERAVQAAIEWLGEQDPAGPPLFLWVHLMGPHEPYTPTPFGAIDYGTLFTDPGYEGRADGTRETMIPMAKRGLSPADVRHLIALYDGEIARVNRLLYVLARSASDQEGGGRPNWLADSVLVFAADHGEELNQRHAYWGHSKSVYGSALQVPLFLRHPGSLTGSRVLDEVVELADVLPTLTDWFGLKTPADVSGRSLLPLVDTYVRKSFESRPAFGMWNDRIFTLRNERYRLIWNPEEIEPTNPPEGPYPIGMVELYDLARDPRELREMSAEEPEVTAGLVRELSLWVEGQPQGGEDAAELSAERRAALEALGYLDGQD